MSGNGEPVIFERNLIKEIWEEEVNKIISDYIEYRKDPSKFKVHTSEIELNINSLKEAIQFEADRIWILVKV